MCGIAGILDLQLTNSISLGDLKRMLTRIQHRGPDESGIYIGDQIGMGNVRLSIIDLNTGQQPIANTNKNLWIVFNGEIFNYVELRKELAGKGHVFQTTSDTEVMVHLYEEYGSDCLEKLNGQFAIAIWDKEKKELFLARDRVGIRPLYYTQTSECFVFGSEIKTLAEHPGVQLEILPVALSQIFTFWTTLSPHTAFKNIYELPPGHFMLVDKTGIHIKQYWKLSFPGKGNEEYLSLERALEEFNALFKDAVRIRLRADVPVGAYLSGGIDSSITTAYIKNIFPDLLRTFSIGFTEKEFDESSYQKMAVRHLQTNHTAVSCSSKDVADKFPDVVWHTEIPILRTAPVPMYYLSKSVQDNNFKVVITGEGADEMLAGYNIFKEMIIRRFWAREPNSKFRPLLLQKLYPYLPQMQGARGNMLKFFFGYKLEDTHSPIYSHLLRWNNTSRIRNHFSETFKESTKDYDPIQDLTEQLPEEFRMMDPLAQAQWLESTIFMSGYLLSSQGDRMAMANSIEGRYPFLDHRIIEFCSRLSPGFKLKGLTEKYLLKELMRDKLPPLIINRPKQAYRAPIASAFTADSPEYVKELLSEQNLSASDIFNPLSVNQLYTKMQSGNSISEVDNMAITGILSTLLMYQKFIQKMDRPKNSLDPQKCKIVDETTLNTY